MSVKDGYANCALDLDTSRSSMAASARWVAASGNQFRDPER
jgi:hypothetical protein